MHEIQGQVLRPVQGETTSKGKIKYPVAFSDGQTYVTFDAALAGQVNALVGQPVIAQVEVSQNGQYTNYNLRAIRSANGAPVAVAPAPVPVAPAPQGGRGRDPEVEARIVRQSVMSTAFNFVGHVYTGAGPELLGEARSHAVALAKELFTLVFGGAHGANGGLTEASTPTAPAATSAPQVAAQVNEVIGGSVQVGAGTPDW